VNGANLTGVNFTGAASTQAAHSVSLQWNASTSTVTGYNIYRSTTSGSGYVKLNGSPLTNLTYTDGSVSAGTTYFYVATAVDSAGDESTDSNQATAVIP
jgi:fibronectin type 3 domain-containing protein